MTGRIVVVTGTGTGVGKTITTAALAVQAADLGSVIVVKPVQTGMGPEHTDKADVAVVHALTKCPTLEFTTMDDPLAPDSAARLRGVQIPSVAEYIERILALADRYDCVLVEGAGGLLVRLDTNGGTLLDLAAAVDAQVFVVVAAGLGTLNHTELTVGALRARGIEPSGLVLGSWPLEPNQAEARNREDLPRISGVPITATIPAGAGELDEETFRQLVPTWHE